VQFVASREPVTLIAVEDRRELFDEWAGAYDADVAANQGFPFAGYDQVLAHIMVRAGAQPGMAVLDLGTGTGALAARFVAAGCDVVGVDFSPPMLENARGKVTAATFVQASLTGELPDLGRRFDRIVSAYAFHHLRPTERQRLVTQLFERHLVRDGIVVVGDIAFPTAADLDRARRDLGRRWDDHEFYLVADDERAALATLGLRAEYEPVSFCAGVFTLRA
jgi:putative AdoMet-dependent methyltransferase